MHFVTASCEVGAECSGEDAAPSDQRVASNADAEWARCHMVLEKPN
jgi:hypothetical protein